MKLYHVVSLSWTFLVVQWNEYTGSVATFFSLLFPFRDYNYFRFGREYIDFFTRLSEIA